MDVRHAVPQVPSVSAQVWAADLGGNRGMDPHINAPSFFAFLDVLLHTNKIRVKGFASRACGAQLFAANALQAPVVESRLGRRMLELTVLLFRILE